MASFGRQGSVVCEYRPLGSGFGVRICLGAGDFRGIVAPPGDRLPGFFEIL